MSIQLKLAWRYLWGRKLRTSLTTLAVIFGVLVIFSMNILIPSMLQAFQANMLAASNQVDMTITHRTGGAFPANVTAQVKAVSGVRIVTGSLGRPVNLPADFYDNGPSTPDKISVLSLIGVDLATVQSLHSYQMQSGRFLQAADASACIIAASLADDLGLKLGDSLKLPTTQGIVSLTVVGIRPARAQPGNEEVVIALPEAQRLLEQPDQINTIEANYDTSDAVRRAEIQKAIETRLGSSYTLGALPSGSDMYASIQLGEVAFSIFGALALFMGAFIIFNTFRTIIAERRRDIGMLRAVGANRGTILGIILTERLLQGALGTAIGMLLGYLLDLVA
jgi:putative ABC transport system permease protein